MQTLKTNSKLRSRKEILRELAAKRIRRMGTGALSPRAAEAVEALHRIDTGSYGTCIDCKEKIPVARLRAKPKAIRCVQCQDVDEQDGGVEAS